MSQDALAGAVKDWLRSKLSLEELECDLVAGGQPVPGSGQEFIGIHDDGWQDSPHGDFDLDESFGILITVTRRMGMYPLDTIGSHLLYKWGEGLGPRLRQIIAGEARLHMNYTVMNAANAIIGDGSSGFVEPLRFKGVGPVMLKGPDWFYARAETRQEGKRTVSMGVCGVARTIRFGGARRVQNLEGPT